jgi:hypothetical protein
MQTKFTTTGDRLLAQLPEAQRAAAQSEAFALFQSDARLSFVEAIAFTVSAMLAAPQPQVVEVESASQPGVRYTVDLTTGRCSCPASQFNRPCWHLKAARAQQQKAAA